MKTALTITLLGLLITSYAMNNGGEGLGGARGDSVLIKAETSSRYNIGNGGETVGAINARIDEKGVTYSVDGINFVNAQEAYDYVKRLKVKESITTNGKLDVDKLAEYLSNN